ncbi:MAG: MBL fold metallo-hydrolase [Bacteroidales bacterium]|nr:MBL fold metallo-hydrolase [Bacteroidales bacterium]
MQITERIHQLTLPFKIKLSDTVAIERAVNIFILLGKHVSLVDAGPSGSEKIIFEYLENIGRSPEEIKFLLLTHAHPDHMGAAAAIKEKTKCKVAIHPSEKEWISNIHYQFEQRPVPGFFDLAPLPVQAELLLNDGDILDIDVKLRIKVVHTPGHSPGSVCFLLQQDNALFTGDAIPLKNTPPIFDNWSESLTSMEKIENLPYPKYLLSAWHPLAQENEVQDFISDGIEWLYQIYTAFDKLRSIEKGSIDNIARRLLKELNISEENFNPLFQRTIERML